MLIAVEAFFAGVLVALQNYWLGGAALLLGLRSLGSMARYRTARQIVGLSTAPFVLALVVVWPLRIAVFGEDLFRSDGSDEGTTGYVLNGVDAFFVLWAILLAIVGVRTVEGWGLVRSSGRRPSPRRCSACCSRPRSSRSETFSASSSSGIEYVCCSSGKAPLRTSSAYVSSASRATSEVCVSLDEARSAPLVQPEQVVPDEHLPVTLRAGADADRRDAQRAVMRAATWGGTHSSTSEKQPASSSARASSNSCRALLGRAPWALKPPSIVADCGVSPMWPMTGMPEPTSALARASIGPRLRSSPRPRRPP